MNIPNRYILTGFFLMLSWAMQSSISLNQPCDSLIRQGVEAMQQKEHHISLELLAKAQKEAEDTKNYPCLFLSYNNIGANYYGLLDYGEALDNYLKAYNIALKFLDSSKEMVVLNNIAILYSKDSKDEKAEEYFLKAYRIAQKDDDSRSIARYATNLGLVSNKLKKLAEAQSYFQEALSLLDKQNDLEIESRLGLAENYLLQKKPDKTIELINRLLPKLESMEHTDFESLAYYLLAKSHHQKRELEEAIYYGQKSLGLNKNLDGKKDIFELLAGLYSDNKELEKVVQMKDSLLAVNYEIYAVKNGRLFETNKVKFEIQQFQQELVEKDLALKAERRTYILIILGILIGLGFIIYAWRNSRIKNEQRKAITQQNKELLTLELEKEKSDHLLLEKKMKEQENLAKLEKKQLQLKIEQRNRKLTVIALQKGNRNQIIENIIQSLSHHPALKNNKDIKSYIQELKKHLKNDGEKDEFFKHFEEVNPKFIKTLTHNHPTLTSNDIRFICYLYMNLSTKEIAGLFNITYAACRKRKERIAAKLDLPNSGEIHSYIFSI